MNKQDRWSALSMKDRADLIKLYVESGITDLGEIRKDYNSFGDGGFVDWDKVDRFVEKAEPWVSGTSLAATGTALAISAASGGTAAPVALPVAATISTISNGAGVLIDGYQAVRDFQKGDYKSGAWNGVEAIFGAAGAKLASKLAHTRSGRAIGKFKEQLVEDRFRASGDKITRLMRKGLTYEQAAEKAMQNAVNYVDNSSKVRDAAKGIRDHYDEKFKKGTGVVDTVFDTIDVGEGIYSRFKEEPPIEIYKIGGKLNKFETGGPTNQNVDSNWLKSFKELPDGYKKAVLQLVTDLNYDVKDAESLYNSGKLKAVIEAKYQNAPSGRVRQNDSPTSTESSNLEKKMNKMLYNSTDRVLPNMKYAIPYIEELEVKVPGVGRTTTNALDSLAKYAVQAQIPLSEALGLSAQETAFGALPQYNYVEVVGAEEEKQKARDFNRALGNSSYFRNYGIIPAENFVRDFRYNIVEDPIDRDVPPLLHAFNYWKKGNYNRGDSDHTKDVKAKGEAVMKTKVIQDWINSSKFAQEALNLFK